MIAGYLFSPSLHPLMQPIAMPEMFVELSEEDAVRLVSSAFLFLYITSAQLVPSLALLVLYLYSFFVPLVSIARSQRARTARQLSTTGCWPGDVVQFVYGKPVDLLSPKFHPTKAAGKVAIYMDGSEVRSAQHLSCSRFPPPAPCSLRSLSPSLPLCLNIDSSGHFPQESRTHLSASF